YGLVHALAPRVYRLKIDARALILTGAACALFLICALGPFAVLYLCDLGGYRASWHGWVVSMRMEETVHPITPFNLLVLAFFFFVASPLVFCALPFAALKEWRARGCSPLLVLALIGFLANLLLITHYSAIINGRYQLTGLPGAIPLVAAYLLRRQRARGADATRALRRVFIDTDARLWFTDNWRGQETHQLVALQARYHFRRIADTIYELRPLADQTAHDDPQLARLLDKPPSRLPFLNRR